MMKQHAFPAIRRAGVLLLLTGLALSGCGRSSNGSAPGTPSPSPVPPTPTVSGTAKPAATPVPQDPLLDRIAKLTLDQKIGQMVLVGLEGTSMQAHAREMIDTYKVTGFILYKDNITGSAQTRALLTQLKEQNRANPFPLWLSVDQEGGRVDRFPAEYVKIPTMHEVGKTNKPAYSNLIGQALGEEVRSLGFNMDFAPVLDVNNNPNNPVIGDRSFGATPDVVIQHGIQVLKGIQSKQVVPVVKHFPGHGDTSVDSHLELPVIPKSLDALRAFELKPFAEAIRQQADAVMVGHLLLPKLDETNPATLSPKVITDLLRGELKFDGVVITDDMTMGGITKHAGIGDAAVRSVQAGSDILLVGHDYEQQKAVLQALKGAVQNGTLSEKRLEASIYRIAKLKEKYGVQDGPIPATDVQAVNRVIQSALEAGKK